MGATAQTTQQGATLHYAEQVWKVSPWTYGVMGEYEIYLEDQALFRLGRQLPLLDPNEAARFRREHIEMLGSRAWSFGTPLCYQSLDSQENLARLLWLCLKVNHGQVEVQLAQEMVREINQEVKDAMLLANPTILKKTANPASSTQTA